MIIFALPPGYNSTQSFNDKEMAMPLHNYVFPDGTQPIKVADPAPEIMPQKENRPGMASMASALDQIVGEFPSRQS